MMVVAGTNQTEESIRAWLSLIYICNSSIFQLASEAVEKLKLPLPDELHIYIALLWLHHALTSDL